MRYINDTAILLISISKCIKESCETIYVFQMLGTDRDREIKFHMMYSSVLIKWQVVFSGV